MSSATTASGVERIAQAFARACRPTRRARSVSVRGRSRPRDVGRDDRGDGPAGADIIELGIPYGDPLADGPTNAAVAQRSLDGGTSIDDALALAANAVRAGAPPILMFTYFNPVLQFGLERFDTLVARGVCGAIVLVVPLEESGPIRAAFAPRGLAFPLLVAPTTPAERAKTIAAASDGFTCLVSRLGVTSASKEPDFAWIAALGRSLRDLLDISEMLRERDVALRSLTDHIDTGHRCGPYAAAAKRRSETLGRSSAVAS